LKIAVVTDINFCTLRVIRFNLTKMGVRASTWFWGSQMDLIRLFGQML